MDPEYRLKGEAEKKYPSDEMLQSIYYYWRISFEKKKKTLGFMTPRTSILSLFVMVNKWSNVYAINRCRSKGNRRAEKKKFTATPTPQ